jgi:hypothetical protein
MGLRFLAIYSCILDINEKRVLMKKLGLSWILMGMMVFIMILENGCSQREKQSLEYQITAQSMSNVITKQASACLNQCRAYISVWEYARVSEMDYWSALNELLDKDPVDVNRDLEQMKDEIGLLMKRLEAPPPEHASTYDSLLLIHDLYLKIHDMTVSVDEPIEEFQASLNRQEEELWEAKKEFDALFSQE